MYFTKTRAFIESADAWPSNQWITEHGLAIYLRRRQHHALEDQPHSLIYLDISNVRAKKPGKGLFTKFMTFVEALPINLYIENVHNERLYTWFDRRPGYKRDPYQPFPCFYRIHPNDS